MLSISKCRLCQHLGCSPHSCHVCRAFSPLEGFMSEQQYLSVVQNMRLPVRPACSSHPVLKFTSLAAGQ